MTIIFAMLFALSAAGNAILVWYIRRLIKNLNNGVKGIDDLQALLEEYTGLLEGMVQLDQYYGDDTINGAIKNTKLVIEACKFYKKSVLDIEDEANIDTEQTK